MVKRRSTKRRSNRRRHSRRRGGAAVEPFRIMFGAQEVQNGAVIAQETTEQPFSFQIDANPNQLFTVIMYDINAVVPAYIHYMYINVRNNDPLTGNEFYSYEPARPPPGTGRHEYVVLAGQQREFIQPVPVHEERDGHDIETIIDSLDLERMISLRFFIDAPAA